MPTMWLKPAANGLLAEQIYANYDYRLPPIARDSIPEIAAIYNHKM